MSKKIFQFNREATMELRDALQGRADRLIPVLQELVRWHQAGKSGNLKNEWAFIPASRAGAVETERRRLQRTMKAMSASIENISPELRRQLQTGRSLGDLM